jgi:glycerophosphoryl diester phosphodiesterase
MDVRSTKDGRLVVFHDAQTVPRSGGKALPVASLTLDDLRNPSLEVHDRVASLEETLRALLGRTGVLLEMKDTGIEDRVVAAVRSMKADTRLKWLVVASFHPESVRAVLRAAPELRTALIVGRNGPGFAGRLRGWRPLAAWKSSGAHDLCVEHSLVTPALVKGVAAKEGRVFPWTVNEAADIRRVVAAGCAGVITDNPEACRGNV